MVDLVYGDTELTFQTKLYTFAGSVVGVVCTTAGAWVGIVSGDHGAITNAGGVNSEIKSAMAWAFMTVRG